MPSLWWGSCAASFPAQPRGAIGRESWWAWSGAVGKQITCKHYPTWLRWGCLQPRQVLKSQEIGRRKLCGISTSKRTLTQTAPLAPCDGEFTAGGQSKQMDSRVLLRARSHLWWCHWMRKRRPSLLQSLEHRQLTLLEPELSARGGLFSISNS